MSKTKSADRGKEEVVVGGALMNNLVHIPMTPAAQRERKKGKGWIESEMGRWRKKRWRWTEEGKIKARGNGERDE